VGKYFDALLVDLSGAAVYDTFEWDSTEDKFQKFINLGDDRNIKEVYVEGKKIKG
jgi:guanine deaminase